MTNYPSRFRMLILQESSKIMLSPRPRVSPNPAEKEKTENTEQQGNTNCKGTPKPSQSTPSS